MNVLISAGEPSGDRIAGGIARALRARGASCFGMGGEASVRSGVAVAADIRSSAAMGVTEVLGPLPASVSAFLKLLRQTRATPPRAAVLVGYTEFHHLLGRHLRRLGVPVLWCVAPQVWAWRPARTKKIARAFDRLAVILPFEESLWRDAEVEADYVGHPAMDPVFVDRPTQRARLGLDPQRIAVGLLPGSRAHEVRRHTLPMLAALEELTKLGFPVDARLMVAPSLGESTRRWLLENARVAGVPTIDVDPELGAPECLGAFDAAWVASGTASLESALAGAIPVIVYRLSRMSAAVARRLVRTPHVGLPNVLLGARHYPELLGDEVAGPRMARTMARVLESRASFEPLARDLRRRLHWNAPVTARPWGPTSSDRMASMVHDWLGIAPERPNASSGPRIVNA